jgi:hypothetical protein
MTDSPPNDVSLKPNLLARLRVAFLRAKARGLIVSKTLRGAVFGAIAFALVLFVQQPKQQLSDPVSLMLWLSERLDAVAAFILISLAVPAWALLRLLPPSQFSKIELKYVSKLTLDKVSLGRAYYDENVQGVMILDEAQSESAAQQLQQEEKLFCFADNIKLCEETAEINFVAFSGSAWGTQLEDKKVRNCGHSQANHRSLMLIEDPQVEIADPKRAPEWIGFTHVIPLNSLGWNQYLTGNVQDNSLPLTYIARPGKSIQGLLVFSIALYKKRLARLYPGWHPGDTRFLSLLLRAVIVHIRSLVDNHITEVEEYQRKKWKSCWVLAQSADKMLQKWFVEELKFQKQPQLSGDNEPMFLGKIWIEK